MVSWAVKEFGGEIPKKESRTLPDFAAEQAVNCDLSSGVLEGLPTPEFIIDLSAFAGTQRAYRFPVAGLADVWLPLPDPNSSVCRSPLADDTTHRLYWTNPPTSATPGQFWNTYARIAAGNTGGNAPYRLGTIQPNPATGPTVAASGGSPGIPEIGRSYTWTYVNQYGEESAPSGPSAVVSGAPDGTWTVTGMPTTAPANPAGKNYPPITQVNLYRTSTGTSTGAQFYVVASFVFAVNPPTSPYTDAVSDTVAVNNLTLISTSFANPLDALDGLTALPGGMLVGFSGNTVHFCEPDRPHAWPAGYDQSVNYEIMGFGVWQQSLVVLTSGFPSTGAGNSPSNYVFTQVRVPEPCISRGSIITDLMGVYYASQNGLVMLNYYGMQNQTLSTMTKNIWLNDFHATNIMACRHRSQYLAINGTGAGFLIEYGDQKAGIVHLSNFADATSIWNDEFSGDAYICADGIVYRWDSPSTVPLVYRWRSKQFYGVAPVNVGAAQVSLDPDIRTTVAPPAPPLDNGDPTLDLPDGINAVFRIYAGPDGSHLVYTRNLTLVREIFALPSGFKSYDWQFEVVSRVGIRSVELASTMRELRDV